MKRRNFITSLGTLSSLALSPSLLACPLTLKPLNILVLGGTNFLGPAIVDQLLAGGHNVSLFNRGITRPDLFPDITVHYGDRSLGMEGYHSLHTRNTSWDLVIDVWPDNPSYVGQAGEILAKKTGHYIFISSIAVYRNYRDTGLDETAPLHSAIAYEAGNYNANKVLCEAEVRKHFPGKYTIVRPGAIVGDRDPGPFGTYLLRRIKEEAVIMEPDSDDPVQFIDARDIARFLAHCAENRIFGHFNLLGPEEPMGYKSLILAARKALKSEVEILWTDPGFLIDDLQVQPFSEIPFWIPVARDPEPGFYQISFDKAMDHGLKFTSFNKTVCDSLESYRKGRYIPEPGSESYFGLSRERELEIISRWKGRRITE